MKIELIRTDGATQSRSEISDSDVSEYAEALAEKRPGDKQPIAAFRGARRQARRLGVRSPRAMVAANRRVQRAGGASPCHRMGMVRSIARQTTTI